MSEIDRDALGREVRRVWIAWAREQPNPKPSWLVPYDELSEPDKEVDRRIGERLFLQGSATLTREVEGLREALIQIRAECEGVDIGVMGLVTRMVNAALAATTDTKEAIDAE